MLKLLLPKSIGRPTSSISTHKHSEKEWYLPWITYFLVSFRIQITVGRSTSTWSKVCTGGNTDGQGDWKVTERLKSHKIFIQTNASPHWCEELEGFQDVYFSQTSSRKQVLLQSVRNFRDKQWKNGTRGFSCERWEKGQQSQISLEESSEIASGE
jgi:hypothetical protein